MRIVILSASFTQPLRICVAGHKSFSTSKQNLIFFSLTTIDFKFMWRSIWSYYSILRTYRHMEKGEVTELRLRYLSQYRPDQPCVHTTQLLCFYARIKSEHSRSANLCSTVTSTTWNRIPAQLPWVLTMFLRDWATFVYFWGWFWCWFRCQVCEWLIPVINFDRIKALHDRIVKKHSFVSSCCQSD